MSPRAPCGDGEAGKRGELAGEGLGRGDTDLRPGKRRQHAVGFARDRGFAHIDDGERALAILTAVPQRRQRVGGLAGLRDEERGTARLETALPVTELGRDIDIDGKLGPALEPIFGDEAGIIGGAAGRDRQTRQLGEIEGELRQRDRARGEIDQARQRVADDLWLLVDLLRHEMTVIALVDEERGGERARHRPLHGIAAAVADGNPFAGQHRPIAVFEIGDFVGEGRECQGVGADEHFASAIADGERAALTGDDHEVVIAAKDHGKRKCAFEPLQRVIDGAHRIVPGTQLAGDEMGDDLGVGVAGEGGAFSHQLLFQLAKILDDAVMHDRDIVGHMRVRVGLGRLAVGRPAGMADAGLAHERRILEARLEIAQFAFGAPPVERAVRHRGDAGGIVAAIFEPLQRVDQLLRNRSPAKDSDDATHQPTPTSTYR